MGDVAADSVVSPPVIQARHQPKTSPSRQLIRLFLRRAGTFWSGEKRVQAWLLTLTVGAIMLVLLGAAYAMNVWHRHLFDGLQKGDGAAVWRLALIYLALLGFSVALSVGQVWARTTLQRSWRAWVTNDVVDQWLDRGRHYQLGLVKGDHTNPESRIADDVRIATEAPVDFVSGVIYAFLTAATFIAVLWSIGGSLDLSFAGVPVVIPGFLVVAAAVYALCASGAMIYVGRHFINAAEGKNQAEAEHRYAITRVRENGESIALIRGEEEERSGLSRALDKVLEAWRRITHQTMKSTIISQTSGYIAPILPILLCAPKFLDGSMTLGQVMQAASAFVAVQGAFNWLVDNYPRLADWSASARRVASLTLSLDALELAEKAGADGRITIRRDSESAALLVRDVAVQLSDGSALLEETEIEIGRGERVLVVGESGTGKSTLVRALAGLWPWGSGEVHLPKGIKLFLLPQKPYIPLGTLRRAVTYPDAASSHEKSKIEQAFKAVGLGHLCNKLDEEETWDQILSGGEKQRIAFARILLHRPEAVVLDEATSALDPESQNKLMQLLLDRFPDLTIISVGHRPELEAFHTRRIVIARRKEGGRIVADDILDARVGARSTWFNGAREAAGERMRAALNAARPIVLGARLPKVVQKDRETRSTELPS